MASIQVSNGAVTVTLSPSDEDGKYGWACFLCRTRYHVQPIADAIADAEIHVDIYHKSESEN